MGIIPLKTAAVRNRDRAEAQGAQKGGKTSGPRSEPIRLRPQRPGGEASGREKEPAPQPRPRAASAAAAPDGRQQPDQRPRQSGAEPDGRVTEAAGHSRPVSQAVGEEGRSGTEPQDLRQQAVRYKAFRHTFSQRDLEQGLDQKKILKKLKKSKHLEDSYFSYLHSLKEDPQRKVIFPWDNPFHRAFFFLRLWSPRLAKWGSIGLLVLLVLNYFPGPTQHVVELFIARSLYDTGSVARLPQSLESYAHSARIVGSDDAVIKSYGKRRVTLQIPEKARKALLACEDHYLLPHPENPWYVNGFLIHAGVSWPNLLGAVIDTLTGRTRGASTIVMQNAKKIIGNRERTIGNKLEEIILAYIMVAKFGKEENLDFYLNTVPVGANIYGFPAAARSYFRKDLEELNTQQLAVIGSFIPNHHRQLAFYEIARGRDLAELDEDQQFHARAAMNKVNLALSYLRDHKEISGADYQKWRLSDEESIRKIGLRDFRSPLYGQEEWASWNVIREVCGQEYQIDGRKVSGSQLILDEPGDVVVETGVGLDLAEKIKSIIADFLSSKSYQNVLERRNRQTWERDLEYYRQSGITPPYEDFDGFMSYLNRHLNVGVLMINQQGEIVAYVGGKEFRQQEESGSDGVVIDLMNKEATLSPASSMKPIIAYYAMVANDADLESRFADKPLEYKYVESADRQLWLPRNWYPYDQAGQGQNRFLGRQYSLLEAQVQSVNTIFARLYTDRVLRNSLLIGFDEIGLRYNQEDAKYWPFGIGATELPVQQWLGVYNAFLDGAYREPAFVKRIRVNDQVIYDGRTDPARQPLPLFDSRPEREAEMQALYEVVSRGTASNLRAEFKYAKNLVSGKTGTAPQGRAAMFIGHFNPYRDRQAHSEHNLTMLVLVTTNTGGYKNVGYSNEGPTVIAGRIFDYLYTRELQQMMDSKMEQAKQEDARFRNNHLYWANVNRYMERLLDKKCGQSYIHENIIGVDGFAEALEQILNSRNEIYTGRDDLFGQLVDYYCNQKKVVRMGHD